MTKVFTPGRILVFLSFGAMFLALLSKTASHGAKAFAVIICFSIIVLGIIFDSKFLTNTVEPNQDLIYKYG